MASLNSTFSTTDGKTADVMLRCIVVNELRDRLGHTPTDTDVDSCLLYLGGNTYSPAATVDRLGYCLDDFVADNYSQCEECGEYFPNEQMREVPARMGYTEKVCSNGCASVVYTDHSEWLGSQPRRADNFDD